MKTEFTRPQEHTLQTLLHGMATRCDILFDTRRIIELMCKSSSEGWLPCNVNNWHEINNRTPESVLGNTNEIILLMNHRLNGTDLTFVTDKHDQVTNTSDMVRITDGKSIQCKTGHPEGKSGDPWASGDWMSTNSNAMLETVNRTEMVVASAEMSVWSELYKSGQPIGSYAKYIPRAEFYKAGGTCIPIHKNLKALIQQVYPI